MREGPYAARLVVFSLEERRTLQQAAVRGLQAVLDEMGAPPGCTTTNQEGELVVGRPEAVYFYSPDGRGPCFVFEGGPRH